MIAVRPDAQKAAELALRRHSTHLRRKFGAHGFSVGYVRPGQIGIVADFEGPVPREFPKSVTVTVGGRKVRVPLKGEPRQPRPRFEQTTSGH